MNILQASLLTASVAAAALLAAAPAGARDAAFESGVQLADSDHGNKGAKKDKGAHGKAERDHDGDDRRPAGKSAGTATGDALEDAVLDSVNAVLRDILGIEDGQPVTGYPGHGQGLPPGLAKRSQLPPGLAKQLRETGSLPPGLQKRLTGDIAARLPGRDVELRAGDLVIVDQQTRQTVAIVEGIMDIFQVASQPN